MVTKPVEFTVTKGPGIQSLKLRQSFFQGVKFPRSCLSSNIKNIYEKLSEPVVDVLN